MTRRSYAYTRGTLPLLNEPIVNPDGTMAESLRLFLEGVQQREGGPGRDALFEIDESLDEAVSDGVLNPAEKLSIIPLISSIQAEESALVAAAAKLGLSTTAYEAAQDAFAVLLATLTTPVMWNSRTGDTTIPDPADFSAKWDAVLDEAAALRAALDSDIADAVLDGVITVAEKRIVVPQIKALQAEETELVSAAANRSVASTAYKGKQDDLATYLATLTSPVAWDNFTGRTTIAAPATFNTRVQDVIEARDALRSAVEAANIRTGNIAANAVSDIVAANTASSAITTTNPKRTNSLTVTETADITNFENDATVIVLVDFEHAIDLGAFDWCVMRLDLKRAKRTGGGSSTRRVWRWVQAGSSSNSQFPAALEVNNQTVTEPFNVFHADTLPGSGDADFDATGYTYTVDIYVTDEWDDGSTMVDGYDTPSSNAKHHRIEDLNLILTHLRR